MRGERAATTAPDPTLKTLTVSNATLSPAFDPETTVYAAVVEASTESVTVAGTPNDDDAEVAFGPSEDADSNQADHQVVVPMGETLTTVTVTAADGETQRAVPGGREPAANGGGDVRVSVLHGNRGRRCSVGDR